MLASGSQDAMIRLWRIALSSLTAAAAADAFDALLKVCFDPVRYPVPALAAICPEFSSDMAFVFFHCSLCRRPKSE